MTVPAKLVVTDTEALEMDMRPWKDDRFLYVPEFGQPKLEYETRDQSYFVKVTMELTGRVHAYELSKVIEALEAEGYEVRKKPPA
jgi:hypothetical protein